MLDRAHLGIARRQGGGQPRVGDRQRADGNVDRLGQVDAAEHDAGVRQRGPQRQLDPLTAVQADADGARERLQSALRKHSPAF